MFRNLKKKTTKNFDWKKKSFNFIFSSCPSFAFALYTLISPNLQIILKKITYPDRSKGSGPLLKI